MQKKIDRVSKCAIWEQQRAFFNQEGINAWSNKIPYYATSNPYIADSYANLIIRFMQDYVRGENYNQHAPFYIIELGAGSGTFSFYTIKRLLELQVALNMQDVAWVYVMTDLAKSNLDFWSTQPKLQNYVNLGVLDFANFDMEVDKHIKLLNSGKVLKKSPAAKENNNPLIVLANYVFDTISQDVFRVTEGKLQEGAIKQTVEIVDEGNKDFVLLSELDKTFSYRDIKIPYYDDNNFNVILTDYEKQLHNTAFLFPVGSLSCIKNLMQIASQKLLLLVTDKGYSKQIELNNEFEPILALHSCFSMMVNFDAIGKYFKQCQGDYYHQSAHQSVTTSVFISGFNFDHLIETKQAAMTYLNNFSHSHILNFYTHMRATRYYCSLDTLISYLSATQWDPQIFNTCFDIILKQISSTPKTMIQDLIDGMPKIAANFYYIPNTVDTLANIGIFFQNLNDYQSALHYYQQSLQVVGAADTTFYNMGLCHFFLQEYDRALAMFKAVITLTPDYIIAKGWIVHIETQMQKLQELNQ